MRFQSLSDISPIQPIICRSNHEGGMVVNRLQGDLAKVENMLDSVGVRHCVPGKTTTKKQIKNRTKTKAHTKKAALDEQLF